MTDDDIDSFDLVVACPECGNDAYLVYPSSLPDAPDYGEYECPECRWNFSYRMFKGET